MTTITGNMNVFQAVASQTTVSSAGVDGVADTSEITVAPSISVKNSSSVTISPLATARLAEAAQTSASPFTLADAVQAANAGTLCQKVNIQASAADFAAHLNALAGLLALGHLNSIILTDGQKPALTVSKSDLGGVLTGSGHTALSVLGKITGAYDLTVTGLTIEDGLALHAPPNAASLTLSISDSVGALAGNMEGLETIARTAAIKDIALANPVSGSARPLLQLDAATFGKDSSILSKIKGDFDLTVTDVAAQDALLMAGAADKILRAAGSFSTMSMISVRDTAGEVLNNFPALETSDVAGRLRHVTLSDKGDVTLSFPQLKAAGDLVPSLPASIEKSSVLLHPDRVVAFVDARLDDSQTLLRDLAGRGVTAYLIDPDRDGLDQIASVLNGYSDLSSVHIFSHGQSGLLQLGSTMIGQADLGSRAGQLQSIGQAMS